MRRKDREITSQKKINEIIQACHCCRLGFCDNGKVYIVPLNFGFEYTDEKRIFYFHGAKEGRKIDLIKRNGYAGFELDTNYQLHTADTACQHSAAYQSIIGEGRIFLIEDPVQKEKALQFIMFHQTHNDDWVISEKMLKTVSVFKLEVTELSCKEHE